MLRTTVKAGSSPVAPFNSVDVVELVDTLVLDTSALCVRVRVSHPYFKYYSGLIVKWLSYCSVKSESRVRFPLRPLIGVHLQTSLV